MKTVNPDPSPVPLDTAARGRIAALASRQKRANGLLMRAVSFAGGQVEDGMRMLPSGVRDRIDGAARAALLQSYDIASRSRGPGRLSAFTDRIGGDRAHKVLTAISGALGGFGGLPTALAELPVATTMIFRAVQGVAEEHGEDPLSEETRLECLRVFGAGGPDTDEAGVDTTFVGARIGLSGAALNGMIARVAPRFAAVLSQKLASQAIPILGAAAGAGVNYAFTDFYVEMAHVHFGLRAESREYGEEAVLDVFHVALAGGRPPVNRA